MRMAFPVLQFLPSLLLLFLFLNQPSFSSGCADDPRYAQRCPGWSSYCSTTWLAQFMQKNCPKTCKFCTPCSCQDHPRYRNSCSRWQSRGLCSSNSWVRTRCPATCNACQCCDERTNARGDKSCDKWASNGHCSSRYQGTLAFMWVYCYKSCSIQSQECSAVSFPSTSTCQCGKEGNTKIVGGQDSKNGKYPWMVALFGIDTATQRGSWIYCGGTLIASRWVVTAAHCLEYGPPPSGWTKNNLYVVLGEFDISSTNDQFDTKRKEVRLQIDPIVHQNYNSPNPLSNDIALLKLAEDVDLNIYTPACLPPIGADYSGQNGRVYGWGSLGHSGGWQLPDILQEVEVGIISDADCEASFETQSSRDMISEDMLCAGAPGKDACQGDSGGPFTVKKKTTQQHELVGVVSWGIGCATDGLFGVYAEVAKLRRWINTKIEANGGATFCA